MKNVREDPETLGAEVGATVRGGPHNRKALIVAPDASKMTTRHDDIATITHWCVVYETKRGSSSTYDIKGPRFSLSANAFKVISSGYMLSFSMAMIERDGPTPWIDQFDRCREKAKLVELERTHLGFDTQNLSWDCYFECLMLWPWPGSLDNVACSYNNYPSTSDLGGRP